MGWRENGRIVRGIDKRRDGVDESGVMKTGKEREGWGTFIILFSMRM